MLTNHELEKRLAAAFDTVEFETVAHVYADWLIERGEPHGAFLSHQLSAGASAATKQQTAEYQSNVSRSLLGDARVTWSKGFIREIRWTTTPSLEVALAHPALRLLSRLRARTARLYAAFAAGGAALPPSLRAIEVAQFEIDPARFSQLFEAPGLDHMEEVVVPINAYARPLTATTVGIHVLTAEESAERERTERKVVDAVVAARGARALGRRLVLEMQPDQVRAWRRELREVLPSVRTRPFDPIGPRCTAAPRFASADSQQQATQRQTGDQPSALASLCADCGSSAVRVIHEHRWSWDAGRRPSTGVMHRGYGLKREVVCLECGLFTSAEERDEPGFLLERYDDD